MIKDSGGEIKKNVLHLSIMDYAGAGHRWSESVNRVGKYNSTSVKVFSHRYGYKSDYTIHDSGHGRKPWRLLQQSQRLEDKARVLYIKERFARVQRMIYDADILHLSGDFPIFEYTDPIIMGGPVGLRIPVRKPIVMTTVGGRFHRGIRTSCHSLEDYKRHSNARTVCTPDINYPEFEADWVPCPIDSRGIKNLWAENGHIHANHLVIGHSPSSRLYKQTDSVFIPALDILKKRGIKFEMDIIEGVSYAECVERKKSLSLFFDQADVEEYGWFGCSLTEAAQFGVPSMAWISPLAISHLKEGERDVPIVSFVPTPEGLADAMINIFETDMLTLSKQTKQWVDDVQSYEAVGAKLTKIYDRVL